MTDTQYMIQAIAQEATEVARAATLAVTVTRKETITEHKVSQ